METTWKTMNDKNETFERNGKEIKRQKCDTYARVMWYIRPIQRANLWKKSEFYSRVNFVEWCMCKREIDMIQNNRDFILQYSNASN